MIQLSEVFKLSLVMHLSCKTSYLRPSVIKCQCVALQSSLLTRTWYAAVAEFMRIYTSILVWKVHEGKYQNHILMLKVAQHL